jgi:hypothetical protein
MISRCAGCVERSCQLNRAPCGNGSFSFLLRFAKTVIPFSLMRSRWRTVFVLGSLVLTFIAIACQDPTQVMIDVRTDVSYRPGLVTSFTVGATPAEVETAELTTESSDPWGADGRIGSLAVVPRSSSDNGRISVKVVMGIRRAARDCKPPQYEGCIVARRALYYVPSQLLRLPIALYANCESVACDQESTCNALGQCVSAEVDLRSCTERGDCALIAETSPEAGMVMPDASRPPLTDGGMSGEDATTSREDAMTPLDASGDAQDASDDASDAGGDAAGDASDGSSGTLSPSYIDCPDAPDDRCDKNAGSGQKCCYRYLLLSDRGRCVAAPTPCERFESVIFCDDNTDCAEGQSCCHVVDAGSFQCVTGSCSGENLRDVCHVSGMCSSSTCTNAIQLHYRACAGQTM